MAVSIVSLLGWLFASACSAFKKAISYSRKSKYFPKKEMIYLAGAFTVALAIFTAITAESNFFYSYAVYLMKAVEVALRVLMMYFILKAITSIKSWKTVIMAFSSIILFMLIIWMGQRVGIDVMEVIKWLKNPDLISVVEKIFF